MKRRPVKHAVQGHIIVNILRMCGDSLLGQPKHKRAEEEKNDIATKVRGVLDHK
jgi:hypothetical protein